MKGFKLQHNDKIVTSSIKKGVTIISIDDLCVSFGGLDTEIDSHVRWYISELKEGDNIIIDIVEGVASADVISSTPAKRDELKEFYSLKKYLQGEGLIEKED